MDTNTPDIKYCLASMKPAPPGREPIHFTGIPDSCDLCGSNIADGNFFGDAEIPSVGRWGYLCSVCIANQKVRFEWGKGQLYQKQPGESAKWLLVAGYPE